MKKIKISMVLAALLLLHIGTTTKSEAWELTNPSTWFDDKKEILKPITFDLLYPTPFYKTDLFQWSAIGVISIAVAATTVVTMGATSVPGATFIGSILGTTWTAGLATLGGGTLASGGFGMAGGAFVIATTTDLAIAGLASFLPIPENKLEGKDYTIIKIPLPEKKGSKEVLELYVAIENITEVYIDGDLAEEAYEQTIHTNYVAALENVNPNETSYDLINGAILAYNLGKYKKSQSYLNDAKKVFPTKSSFIYYHQALLYLVDYDIDKAMKNLNNAILEEPDALNSYLLKAQIAIDNNQSILAKDTIDEGLKGFDDGNFQLNYIRAMITYNEKNYQEAIEYFEEALSNMTINEIEAECKIWIAKCYKHLNNTKKSNKWYLDGMDEINDNKKYQNKLSDMYHSKEKND